MSPGRAGAGLLLGALLAFSGTACGKYGKPVRRSPQERVQVAPDVANESRGYRVYEESTR